MANNTDYRESRIKSGYFVCYVMFSCLLVQKATTDNIILPAMNWWAARDHCKRGYNGDMFLPMHGLRLSGSSDAWYWIGAFETSEWRWTDNSALISRIGFMPNYTLGPQDNYVEFPGNSVAKCYSSCYPSDYIGLQDTRCYCLKDHHRTTLSRIEDERPCPGNQADECGNAYGMTVYKSDVRLNDSQTGECAFGRSWHKYMYMYRLKHYMYIQTANCSETYLSVCLSYGAPWNSLCKGYDNLFYRCWNNVCATCDVSTWSSANNSCNLVKISKENKESISSTMTESYPYWIGLNRATRKVWNNGSEVDRSYRVRGDEYPRCLALWLRNDKWTLLWIPCEWSVRAICVTQTVVSNDAMQKEETTKTTQRVTSRPAATLHLTDSTTRIDPGKTRKYLPSSTVNNVITTASEQQETEEVLRGETEEMKTNYGLFVGTGLAVLLLAISITVLLVVTKRKERFCFRKKQTTGVRFQVGTENLNSGTGQQHERHHAPFYVTLEPLGQVASTRADANRPDIVSDLYSKVDKTQRKTAEVYHGQAKEETRPMHSNTCIDDPDVYSRAGQWKSLEVDNNCYNHLNTDGENDYDIAGGKPDIDRRDSTYNHLGALQVDEEEIHDTRMSGDTDYYNIVSTATRK